MGFSAHSLHGYVDIWLNSELNIIINQIRQNNSVLNIPVSLLTCIQMLRKIREDAGNEAEANL